MPVIAKKAFIGEPSDTVDKYEGKQLLFVSWDHHLIFASPFLHCVDPAMNLTEFLNQVVKPLMGADPDSEQVHWESAEWKKANQPWKPDFSKSLAENGVVHKELLRFHTPGLNTVCGL